MADRLAKFKIILASGSPRRQQFFKDMGLEFEIRVKEVDEVYPSDLKAAAITDFLAVLKANAFEGELADDELLVTSDTLVWHLKKALGKPKDFDDATAILKSLSDSTHQVITSVCFKTARRIDVIHDITEVTFAKLSADMIQYYLDTYKPFDKAGAYGIQEWIGLVGITNIKGSYSNVVGLPTQKVYDFLKNENYII